MKKESFDELLESVREAGRILRGEQKPSREFTFAPEDVRAIRAKLRKSQDEFALMIGVSVATLRNWEQGRRHPHGPARALLKVAASHPKAPQHPPKKKKTPPVRWAGRGPPWGAPNGPRASRGLQFAPATAC